MNRQALAKPPADASPSPREEGQGEGEWLPVLRRLNFDPRALIISPLRIPA
jgi:hypothetical protein